MGVISIFLIISLLITISPTTSSALRHRINVAPPSSNPIRQACKATRNQSLCESSLAKSPESKPIEIIQSALSISSENLHTAQSNVKSILTSSSKNLNLSTAAKNCIEHLSNSEYRLNTTAEALRHGGIKDARAWTSAGLAYQSDCWSALKYVNDTKIVVDTMSMLDTLIVYMSNVLSMITAYDVFGDKMESWSPPKTERGGFWERGGAGGVSKQLGVPAGLKVDVTVCKGGGCNYTTVQAAVNGAPNWSGTGLRFVILVKAGVYKETVRVGLEKQNMVFLGEGMGKTIITGSMNVGEQTGMSTYNSATVGVVGDRFMASNLTMENTAGPEGHQAVAFRTASDQSIMENCEFLGNQDTLYVHTLRQLFKSCRIQGNVDFIFGNSAAIFQDCTILIRPRQATPEKGEKNAVTAHARTDPAMSTGFVFQNCLVNGTEEYMKLYNSNPKVHKSFLGRPWKEYARTVFIGCKIEALITPEGWMPWKEDFALKTLYYGEFNNSGKGSGLPGRVPWSNQIPLEHEHSLYSITNFIQGDQWKVAS